MNEAAARDGGAARGRGPGGARDAAGPDGRRSTTLTDRQREAIAWLLGLFADGWRPPGVERHDDQEEDRA